MILKTEDLVAIQGGAIKITAAYINAIARGASILLEIGRTIGSAIRRGLSKKYC